MKNKNRIPRHFIKIVGETLTATSHTKPGDILHIFKDFSGYLLYNTKTGVYARVFPSMLRDAETFKIHSII